MPTAENITCQQYKGLEVCGAGDAKWCKDCDKNLCPRCWEETLCVWDTHKEQQ